MREEELREVKPTRFKIDENDLVGEWLRTPGEIFYWARKLADLRKEKATMDYQLELLEAEADAEIRADPEKYNVLKITEASVKAAMSLRPEIREFKEKMHEVAKDIMICNGAVDATNAIKSALPDLVKLKLSTYYSDPKEPEGVDVQTYKKAELTKATEEKTSRTVSNRRTKTEE